MSHAANLISALRDNIESIKANAERRVQRGRISQEKADAVVAEFVAEVDAAIAAINEVNDAKGEESVECIKLSQAQTNDMQGIIEMGHRLMGRA